jgi:hypothetical protein
VGGVLQRTRTVLNRTGHVDPTAGVEFGTEREDDADSLDRPYEISLPEGVWEDMGQPDVITVSIEPGDKLNPAKRKRTAKKAPAARKPATKRRPPVKKKAAKPVARKRPAKKAVKKKARRR